MPQERWTLRYRPTHPRDAGGYVEGPQEEDASEYVAAGLTAAEQQASFDLVVVDGRGRPACVARAMRLLKPSGGVLVVDNAERPLVGEALAGVPGHWLRFDAATSASTTAVFVTCTPGAC